MQHYQSWISQIIAHWLVRDYLFLCYWMILILWWRMSIIYALIAKEASEDIVNLCSYDAAHGNYPSVTYEILKSVKIAQSITYKYNEEYCRWNFRYSYHILKDGALLFVCLSDSGLKVRNAFAFLEELRKKFREKYSNEEIAVAKKYEFSASFSEIFQAQVVIVLRCRWYLMASVRRTRKKF